MFKEDLEKAIVHANVCLKDWKQHRPHLLDVEGTRSLIIGWIVRILNRNAGGPPDWRFRKQYSRGIAKSLFYTIDEQRGCFTSLRVGDSQAILLPMLDFEELNRRSEELFTKSSLPEKVQQVSFETIEQIKFS